MIFGFLPWAWVGGFQGYWFSGSWFMGFQLITSEGGGGLTQGEAFSVHIYMRLWLLTQIVNIFGSG